MDLRIKDICREQGMSIPKLAEMLGITNQSMHGILNKSNPTLDTLEKISIALNVPVSDLIIDPKSDTSNSDNGKLCPHCGKEIHITLS